MSFRHARIFLPVGSSRLAVSPYSKLQAKLKANHLLAVASYLAYKYECDTDFFFHLIQQESAFSKMLKYFFHNQTHDAN